jgi:hypothetical protein
MRPGTDLPCGFLRRVLVAIQHDHGRTARSQHDGMIATHSAARARHQCDFAVE